MEDETDNWNAQKHWREASRSDHPARWLTECCLTLVRGSSRAHGGAVEALGSTVESGEDVDVGQGSRHDPNGVSGTLY